MFSHGTAAVVVNVSSDQRSDERRRSWATIVDPRKKLNVRAENSWININRTKTKTENRLVKTCRRE